MSLGHIIVTKELSSQLTKNNISSFLTNVNVEEKYLSGEEILKLVEATLLEKLPSSKGKKASKTTIDDLKSKYTNFMSRRFLDLPNEISF